jgi:hypothetical protein
MGWWMLGCICCECDAAMYRCDGPKHTDGSANIVFQAKPCPANFRSKEIAHVQTPTLTEAERARIDGDAAQERQTRRVRPGTGGRKRLNRVGRSKGRGQFGSTSGRYKFRNLPSVAHQGCPPTYENPGVYVVGQKWMRDQYNTRSKAPNGMYAAYLHYKSLPTKTYLKNQGLWPKHCPP